MQWMDAQNIGYARSIYNVAVEIKPSDNGLEIHLATEHGKRPIHYTTDGTLPTIHSNFYSDPLRFTQSIIIKTASFRNGEMLGKVKTKEITIHKGFGKKVILTNKPRKRYPGIENQSLTDLLRGDLQHTHPQWMGFEGEDFSAVIDLGNNAVKLGCL